MSGFLADPVNNVPFLSGTVQWLREYPYSLANLLCSMILSTAALGVLLGLNETHPELCHRPDRGRWLGKYLMRKVTRGLAFNDISYQLISRNNDTDRQISIVRQALESSPLAPK
jgi:hypothetical protein